MPSTVGNGGCPSDTGCTTCYKCGGGCCQLVSAAAQASTPVQKKRLQRPCVSTVAQGRTSLSQVPMHVSNVVENPGFFRSSSRYSVAPPKRRSLRGLRLRRPSACEDRHCMWTDTSRAFVACLDVLSCVVWMCSRLGRNSSGEH